MFQFDDSARCLLKGLAFSLRCVTVGTAGSVELNVTPEEMKHEICSFDLIVTRSLTPAEIMLNVCCVVYSPEN